MDTQLLKKKVYEACVQLQVDKIRQIEHAMSDAQNSAIEYEQPKDIYDSSRLQLLGGRDMYAQKLQTELDQLETLHKIDISICHETVSFGALVITELQNVFVSVGLGKVKVDDSDCFYAISLQVPFYQAMKGLKKGDSFTFRGKEIKILDIC
ncbi:MAG: hypothetical protein JW861_00245 [Bacteroidales bacterium]|nr:hypothetical protein [Bacteroidales bacterium]